MVNIRGVNVYPSGIEAVVRRVPEVAEFRSIVAHSGAMRSLRLEIELGPGVADDRGTAQRVGYRLKEALGLTISVDVVPGGTLPRFEMKASRFVVEG